MVPPLQGFVMNRVQGDYFETLLYKVFVSIDERTSMADLATMIQVDLEQVKVSPIPMQAGQGGYPNAGRVDIPMQAGWISQCRQGRAGWIFQCRQGRVDIPMQGRAGWISQCRQGGYPNAGRVDIPMQAGQGGYPNAGQGGYPNAGRAGWWISQCRQGRVDIPMQGRVDIPMQAGQGGGYPNAGQGRVDIPMQAGQGGYPNAGQGGYNKWPDTISNYHC